MMEELYYPGIVSVAALLVYYFTLFQAGMARGRFNVPAPSHDGPEAYVRYVRAHQNTAEHLILFLPGLWLFAIFGSELWAAIIGAAWPIGRLLYALGYYRAAEKRTMGLIISMLPIYILVLGSGVAIIMRMWTA
jgi:glutathione S-transferase